MFRSVALALALICAGAAGQAQAETNPISLSERADWKHSETGIVIPAKAAGLLRRSGGDYGRSESDILFQYYDESGKTHATLYYFRAGLPNVSIWADRIESTVLQQGRDYGEFDRAGRLWTLFTPTTGGTNSAIRFAYPLSGRSLKATSTALEQRGAWLVAVRISSSILDAKALDALTADFINALAYTPAGETAPAYAMTDCADALPGKKAKQAKPEEGGGFMGAALMGSIAPDVAAEEARNGKARPVPVYCRDAASQAGYGVYRPGGAKYAYVLAAGDAGAVIQVGPDLSAMVKGGNKQQFGLTLISNDQMVGFVPYQTLPPPSQALDSLSSGKPIFVRSRLPGHEKEIQIIM